MSLVGQQNVNISFILGFVSRSDFYTKVSVKSKTVIKFRSVKETGKLAVDVEALAPEVRTTAHVTDVRSGKDTGDRPDVRVLHKRSLQC